jgi:hypothetical protein
MVTLDAAVRQDPLVAYEVLDGEAVLYHEVSNELHLLNPTATLIWQALDGDRDLRAVIEMFVELTGAPEDVIESDVIDAVHDLERLALVRIDGGTDSRFDDGSGDAERA